MRCILICVTSTSTFCFRDLERKEKEDEDGLENASQKFMYVDTKNEIIEFYQTLVKTPVMRRYAKKWTPTR